jgi:hypothetical protein
LWRKPLKKLCIRGTRTETRREREREREREKIGVDGGGSEVYIKKRSNV